MKRATKISMEHRNFQNYVTMIYISLLGIGILFDTIYFSFFDVNVLRYSSVMDILLTPLDFLIEFVAHFSDIGLLKGGILGTVVVVPIIAIILTIKHSNKKYWAKRHTISVNTSNFEKMLKNDKSRRILIKTTILGFFLGLIMPNLFMQLTLPAQEIVDQMKKGELLSSHKITFMDNTEKNVYLIRERSQYVFYIEEQDTQITIAPIVGTIKELKKIGVETTRQGKETNSPQDTSSNTIN